MSAWTSVWTELPPAGVRVQCRNERAIPGDTTGQVDEHGFWDCAEAFVIPPASLTFNPTHWRPLDTGEPA